MDHNRESVVTTFRMRTKTLREMPMSELLRLAKTDKGREFLLEEVETMDALTRQVRAALGDSQMSESSLEINGTVADLVTRYKLDNRYLTLRPGTRVHYDVLLERIIKNIGGKKIADLKDADIDEIYRDWASDGKIAMAHALVTMLRTLVAFGAAAFENHECEVLSVLLHRKRFPGVPARVAQPLSLSQIKRIIAKAHELKKPSIALAQAFQWAVNLRQRDVIGEWVPLSDPDGEYSDLVHGDQKWVRGLKWSQIDKDMVLRHRLSKEGAEIEFKLSSAPLVMAELEKQFGSVGPGRDGPIIRYEKTGLPYDPHVFRYQWRRVAEAAGIPKNIKNMDSRSASGERAESAEVDLNLEANTTPH